MDKKGVFGGMTWYELLSLIILFTFLVFLAPDVIRGVSRFFRESTIDEQETNKFDILVVQMDSLTVEHQEKTYPITIGKDYQIKLYGKCKEGEEIGTDCSYKPKVCLMYTKDEKKAPYCEYVKNTDYFGEQDTISTATHLKLRKIETKEGVITQIYT